MPSWAAILAAIVIALSALGQIVVDPRVSRRFLLDSVVALAIAAAQMAIGALAVAFLFPRGPQAALAATTALIGWIGLGALGLIRRAPRLREPPAALMHFGLADALCLLAVVGGALAAFGGFD